MTVTLDDISAKVLRLVQKEASYQGFFTTAKVTDAINDSFDYISSIMMQQGEGWLKTIGYLTTVANTATVALPTGCAVIHVVRYKVSDIYMPLKYDDQNEQIQTDGTSLTQYPTSYRVVAANLYFNPLPSQVGTNYVQIEYMSYPTALSSGSDAIISQFEFDRSFQQYVKWRAASQLVSQVGKAIPEWERYENEWLARVKEICSKRIKTQQYIKDF